MAPQDSKKCAYCGAHTPYYECVDQVPTTVCSVQFITDHILNKNGNPLTPNDYICTEHELCFS